MATSSAMMAVREQIWKHDIFKEHRSLRDVQEINVCQTGIEKRMDAVARPPWNPTALFPLGSCRTRAIHPATHQQESTNIHRQDHLDERQRLLSAADQRRFLLPLLLHDGGEGHRGGGGRAAHCSQHPGPEGWGAKGRKMMQTDRNAERITIRASNKSLSVWIKVESTATERLLLRDGYLSNWISQASYMITIKYGSDPYHGGR